MNTPHEYVNVIEAAINN